MRRFFLVLAVLGVLVGPWIGAASAQRGGGGGRPMMPGAGGMGGRGMGGMGGMGMHPQMMTPRAPNFQLPNVQRPSGPMTMPGMGAVARPQPMPRPQTPQLPSQARPSTRPSVGGGGGLPTNRPGARPQPLPQPGRPGIGERPSLNPGQRPTVPPVDRPTVPPVNRPTVPPVNRPTVPPVTRPQVPQRPSIVQRPGFTGGNNTVINRPVTNVGVVNNIYRPNYGVPGMGAWTSGYVGRWNNSVPGYYRRWNRPYSWYHGPWHWNWAANRGGVVPWYAYSGLAFRFGYWNFVNPFWTAPAVPPAVFLNYSQPVAAPPPQWQAEDAAPQQPPREVNEQALAQFDQARTAFLRRNYAGAQRLVESALALAPQEAVFHEFRALVLFARGQFAEAASTLYAVLAVHPGWDWTTMSSFYEDLSEYYRQLEALTRARDANPTAANLQFLYAYHNLTAGRTDRAKAALEAASQALPNDPLIAQLLASLGGTPAPAAAPPPKPADVNLDLKGQWRAQHPSGMAITLRLDDQSRFEWKAEGGAAAAADSFAGTFAVDDATLTLDSSEGGALVGRVVPLAADRFLFRLIGAPPQDPGLEFQRVGAAP
ncbi:MAG TPA: tetratricopeptide repeat protein [Gemmatales bacterium]|nr:tetratricopeptide repeat protein [Gemmatales bacterium]